ncbi:MAG: hypothetical protein KAY46_24890 [Burkholderiaceae bacterium]|nr:hypothetical protein [Burkholderiaceae bacterium]
MPIETTKESPAPVSGEWVMVPREPTAEMVSAAYAAHQAVGLPGVAYRAMLAAAPAPATGGVTEGMVDMALDAADYIPNEDNRKWMSLALAAALRSRPTVSPPPVPGEVEALRNALIAVRPIVNSLIEREHNIEWWGLRQRLAAIDAALRCRASISA